MELKVIKVIVRVGAEMSMRSRVMRSMLQALQRENSRITSEG